MSPDTVDADGQDEDLCWVQLEDLTASTALLRIPDKDERISQLMQEVEIEKVVRRYV